MSWIKTIPYEAADKSLKKLYNRVKGPDNHIDEVLKIHSLRPHTLVGHMTLYKSVLHHNANTLPSWYLETLGVYVSYFNRCDYCVTHHYEGLKRLLNTPQRAQELRTAIEQDNFDGILEEPFIAGIHYAKQLTLNLNQLNLEKIDKLRAVGLTDGEILEINQVTAYFNYVNRIVIGLGVNLEKTNIGLSPNKSDHPEAWNHQ
ncbi:peroxidase-related enzyme [Flavobacteriaceae bacterium F08102]|nr:peroxidase-related enzyme [Flavobacteriaceae bacterium F08102]